MRTNCASGLSAPQGFENGALRHKQPHAGRSDDPVVLFPCQGLPPTERLQRRPIAKRFFVFSLHCLHCVPIGALLTHGEIDYGRQHQASRSFRGPSRGLSASLPERSPHLGAPTK